MRLRRPAATLYLPVTALLLSAGMTVPAAASESASDAPTAAPTDVASASDAPDSPSASDAPDAPSASDAPDAPSASDAPDAPSTPDTVDATPVDDGAAPSETDDAEDGEDGDLTQLAPPVVEVLDPDGDHYEGEETGDGLVLRPVDGPREQASGDEGNDVEPVEQLAPPVRARRLRDGAVLEEVYVDGRWVPRDRGADGSASRSTGTRSGAVGRPTPRERPDTGADDIAAVTDPRSDPSDPTDAATRATSTSQVARARSTRGDQDAATDVAMTPTGARGATTPAIVLLAAVVALTAVTLGRRATSR